MSTVKICYDPDDTDSSGAPMPRDGEMISLQRVDGGWETFTVTWFSNDTAILDGVTRMFPVTRDELEKLLSKEVKQ